MPVPDDDLSLLTEAARAAGETLRGHFARGARAWDKPHKAGPVTEADLAANSLLHDRLTGARPGYGWLSEEGPDDPTRRSAARCFVVDPLDGTRSFIEGDHNWSVSLAVVAEGAVVAGVVYLPMRDRLYTAARGQGAWCDGTPMAVATRAELDGARVLSSRRNFVPALWRDGRPAEVQRRHRSSMAYRLALVAEGRYDAMFRLRPAQEWDVAAGTLLVTEAGGRVSDPTGAALRFNGEPPRVPGLVAAGPALHDAICARLA